MLRCNWTLIRESIRNVLLLVVSADTVYRVIKLTGVWNFSGQPFAKDLNGCLGETSGCEEAFVPGYS